MPTRQNSKRTLRWIMPVFVLCLFTVTVNAYTVVMHGGRRVEIPSHFVVTASTLTYEVSPGVQITLNVAAIDVAATEKANNEAPGSLLRRITARSIESWPRADGKATALPATRRTITNRDLESTTQRRRESELAYERRRKQLGLPSVEESRRKEAAESELIAGELVQTRLEQRQTENYWRERAATLRTEMAAMDAEIAFLRARLVEGPAPVSGSWNGWSSASFTTVIGVGGFGNFPNRPFRGFGGRGGFPAGRPMGPGVFVAPNGGAQLTGRVGFGGGATRGQVLINPGFGRARLGGIVGGFPAFPVTGFGSTFPGYDFSYERSALITRFNELGAARAGLSARWRELEEEARRAGASPGWLRP